MRAATVAAGLGVAAVGAGLLAVVAADRRWLAADDPTDADLVRLPDGEERKVETPDGAILAATVAGDSAGPTVVLAHCWMGGRGIWAPVARRLANAGHRVVLYDQRGHGESTLGAAGCTIEALADDLAAVLDQLDVRDAVVAGHSMGGMTIQAFAATHPEVVAQRVERFVLVSTAAGNLRRGRFSSAAGAVIAAPLLDRAMNSRAGHALIRGAVGRRPRHGHLVATRDLLTATEPTVRRDFLTAITAMDLTAGLAGVDVPTTVVCGARDRLTPVRSSRAIAAAVPNARLVTWPDAGHMLPLEMPDELADLIANQEDPS